MNTFLDESSMPLMAPAIPKNGKPPATDDACLERVAQSLREVEIAEEAVQEELNGPSTSLAVSILIPVYNERQTIGEIVRRVQEVGIHQEIIIVDDGSTDGTREALESLACQSDIRVILHDQNRGKGAALRTAMEHAQGEVVLIQDADLEYSPEDYHRLLAPIEQGEAEVVYGSRFLENAQQDPSWLHRAGNRWLTRVSNLTTGQRLSDMETCYKVIRRTLLETICLRQDRFGFEPEITAKLARRGITIREVPIRYQYRSYEAGKKIGLRDGINALYCILRYGWCD